MPRSVRKTLEAERRGREKQGSMERLESSFKEAYLGSTFGFSDPGYLGDIRSRLGIAGFEGPELRKAVEVSNFLRKYVSSWPGVSRDFVRNELGFMNRFFEQQTGNKPKDMGEVVDFVREHKPAYVEHVRRLKEAQVKRIWETPGLREKVLDLWTRLDEVPSSDYDFLGRMDKFSRYFPRKTVSQRRIGSFLKKMEQDPEVGRLAGFMRKLSINPYAFSEIDIMNTFFRMQRGRAPRDVFESVAFTNRNQKEYKKMLRTYDKLEQGLARNLYIDGVSTRVAKGGELDQVLGMAENPLGGREVPAEWKKAAKKAVGKVRSLSQNLQQTLSKAFDTGSFGEGAEATQIDALERPVLVEVLKKARHSMSNGQPLFEDFEEFDRLVRPVGPPKPQAFETAFSELFGETPERAKNPEKILAERLQTLGVGELRNTFRDLSPDAREAVLFTLRRNDPETYMLVSPYPQEHRAELFRQGPALRLLRTAVLEQGGSEHDAELALLTALNSPEFMRDLDEKTFVGRMAKRIREGEPQTAELRKAMGEGLLEIRRARGLPTRDDLADAVYHLFDFRAAGKTLPELEQLLTKNIQGLDVETLETKIPELPQDVQKTVFSFLRNKFPEKYRQLRKLEPGPEGAAFPEYLAKSLEDYRSGKAKLSPKAKEYRKRIERILTEAKEVLGERLEGRRQEHLSDLVTKATGVIEEYFRRINDQEESFDLSHSEFARRKALIRALAFREFLSIFAPKGHTPPVSTEEISSKLGELEKTERNLKEASRKREDIDALLKEQLGLEDFLGKLRMLDNDLYEEVRSKLDVVRSKTDPGEERDKQTRAAIRDAFREKKRKLFESAEELQYQLAEKNADFYGVLGRLMSEEIRIKDPEEKKLVETTLEGLFSDAVLEGGPWKPGIISELFSIFKSPELFKKLGKSFDEVVDLEFPIKEDKYTPLGPGGAAAGPEELHIDKPAEVVAFSPIKQLILDAFLGLEPVESVVQHLGAVKVNSGKTYEYPKEINVSSFNPVQRLNITRIIHGLVEKHPELAKIDPEELYEKILQHNFDEHIRDNKRKMTGSQADFFKKIRPLLIELAKTPIQSTAVLEEKKRVLGQIFTELASREDRTQLLNQIGVLFEHLGFDSLPAELKTPFEKQRFWSDFKRLMSNIQSHEELSEIGTRVPEGEGDKYLKLFKERLFPRIETLWTRPEEIGEEDLEGFCRDMAAQAEDLGLNVSDALGSISSLIEFGLSEDLSNRLLEKSRQLGLIGDS